MTTTTFTDALAALWPLATKHATASGERVGFLMTDAAQALGGLFMLLGASFAVGIATGSILWGLGVLCALRFIGLED